MLIICVLGVYVLNVCAVICRKASFTISVSAVMLPDVNFLSSRAQNRGFCAFLPFETLVFGPSRAQNRGFCALLGSGTLVFGHFEHKIEVFVLGVPLSAASGRVIAAIFEILHGSGRGRVA